ncbi:MAG: hypothetical protein CMG35_03665 [Candidatus Marinimicrobia bacterium]|jgi:hypothetical protein|nr:hypothetical protein [Candidatus Neomarinimicrobiota bacterium]|tara:strand:- start:227 stop:409 length:183 start_codon:yes stop_codon:yes gene_type:complete
MIKVIGYILVAVYIQSDGVVDGKALDYYTDLKKCYYDAVEHESLADPGVGFVCLEDYVVQ